MVVRYTINWWIIPENSRQEFTLNTLAWLVKLTHCIYIKIIISAHLYVCMYGCISGACTQPSQVNKQ